MMNGHHTRNIKKSLRNQRNLLKQSFLISIDTVIHNYAIHCKQIRLKLCAVSAVEHNSG